MGNSSISSLRSVDNVIHLQLMKQTIFLMIKEEILKCGMWDAELGTDLK